MNPEADGIGHIEAMAAQFFIEGADEMRFVVRLRAKHGDGLQVPARHDEDVVGPFHQFVRERLAAQVADIDPQGPEHLDGMRAGRLAVPGADARGGDLNVPAVPRRMPEEALSHGAAADIPGADEQDVFHGEKGNAAERELTGGPGGKSKPLCVLARRGWNSGCMVRVLVAKGT